MRIPTILLIAIAALIVLNFGFIYSGLFNVAADNPHWGLTHQLIESVRDHSIKAAARSVNALPALDNPQLIAMGAQEYDEMCTGCHLAPGMEETEMRAGLYPKPPNFSKEPLDLKPAETFWVIKHGLKMTGMPAWGLTHDDQRLWSMVAIVRKLPQLSQSQYQALIKQGGDSEHHEHGHSQDETAGQEH